MPRTTRHKAHPPLNQRMQILATALREHLRDVVRDATGEVTRPAALIRRLAIDKSLASRLVRALKTADPLELIHTMPAPTGLRIFLDAAERAGVDRDLCRRAAKSVEQFQALIDQVPGGRATVEAAISASVPIARERNDRAARQAVYKAMSYLLGYRCDAVASALFLLPSQSPGQVDSVNLHYKIGLRRLRPSAPISLFSIQNYPSANAMSGHSSSIQTLAGDIAPDDPEQYLLRPYCSDPLPELHIVKDHLGTAMAVGENDPPLDRPVDIAAVQVVRGGWQRWRTERRRDEWRSYLLRWPCRLLVRDVFIHKDAYSAVTPEVTWRLPDAQGERTKREGGLVDRLDAVDLSVPIESLGTGLAGIAAPGMPAYERVVRHVFDQCEWTADHFRVLRCRVLYPVPLVLFTWWFSLAEPPDS